MIQKLYHNDNDSYNSLSDNFLGPRTPLACETGAWGEWKQSVLSSPAFYDTGNSGEETSLVNSEDFVEYEFHDSYVDYNATGDYYEDDTEYNLYIDDIDVPQEVTNCTCYRTDISYELQYRKRQIIKEGTIGGIPCKDKNIKETQNCKCPTYGRIYRIISLGPVFKHTS